MYRIKNHYKLYCIAGLFGCLMALKGMAQFTLDHSNYQKGLGFVTDVSGRKKSSNAYERVTNGSPWWRDEFIPADIFDEKGRAYKNVSIKIDIVGDKVYYLDTKGDSLELLTSIIGLAAFPPGNSDTIKMVRANFFKENEDSEIKGWLLLQVSGDVKLLQNMNKHMYENKGFSSAVSEYSIVNQFQWVVAIDGRLYKVKKTKDIQEVLIRYNPRLKNFKPKEKTTDAQIREWVHACNHM